VNQRNKGRMKERKEGYNKEVWNFLPILKHLDWNWAANSCSLSFNSKCCPKTRLEFLAISQSSIKSRTAWRHSSSTAISPRLSVRSTWRWAFWRRTRPSWMFTSCTRSSCSFCTMKSFWSTSAVFRSVIDWFTTGVTYVIMNF